MADIKISELSIGDWVAYNGKKYRIKEISSPYASVTLWGNNEQRDESIVLIEPISLTPEILEKNGWVQRDQWNWRNPHIKCSCCRYGRKYWDIHMYGKDRKYRPTRITIENILHTHQLQNALRLAGVGKEIEV